MMENVTDVAPEVSLIAEQNKPKRGRPRKDEIRAAMKPNKGKVGRPQGDNHRMLEFKARIMSTKGMAVIEKVLNTALEDGHPAQAACLKMVMDRALPLGMFSENGGGNQKPTIQINIQGLNDTTTMNVIQPSDHDDAEEGEWEDG
jgi:hypothetical protein